METKLLCIALVCLSAATVNGCVPSVTRSKSIRGTICSRTLIFHDNFDRIDTSKWSYEITMAGGGNWEFQTYHDMYGNAFTRNGVLHYAPGFTSDYHGGENFLRTGSINLGDRCTQPNWYGCFRQGNNDNYLNPITSTRLHTTGKFSFTYGQVEVRAKMPAGDWLWPAIWLMPQDSIYGGWPRSGEIDMNESRGNRHLTLNGRNIGVEQASSAMHWGAPKEFWNGKGQWQPTWRNDGSTHMEIDYVRVWSLRALIFEDNFDTIDMSKWSYEITMAGGGNWEFQIYHYMYGNAFTQNGILHYAPGYTSDYYGSEEFLWTGTIDLGAECTQSDWYGCYREGTTDNYLNPITSTRLHTTGKFSFTYGQVEVRAKMPAGDWLWPAIWMMPQDSIYGGWPTSGEIDINEGRGNRDLISNDYIAFSIDGGEIGRVTPPAGGFYELGQITGPNPWAGGSKMAPFDADAPKEFWNGRGQWEPTWHQDGSTHMEIDYVRVWSL
ncbi:hypothetical protein B566_EDAN007028 [Ephemera danica]|nr:hypothetical protein B566_EDAN007028 [Ephemera danica]